MNRLVIAGNDGCFGELTGTRNTELAVGAKISAAAAVVVVGVGIDFFAAAKRRRIVCGRRALSFVTISAGTAVIAASAAVR